MTFKSPWWYPLAVVLSAVNVAAVWFAAEPGEPTHATIHAALAVGFALWAQRLRAGSPRHIELESGMEAINELDADVDSLRNALAETQERLDFAERMLAERVERRMPEQGGQGPRAGA